jgi:phage I-like protein
MKSNGELEICQACHLSPLGDFNHGEGIQRVDRAAADEMVRQFNSFRGQLSRRFAGLPIYVGHPDVPALRPQYPDDTVYGRINRLLIEDEGLAAEIEWEPDAEAMLAYGRYKFLSPYWEAEEIAVENGRSILRPVRLISAGLTNQPNLPVLPLANEEGPGMEPIRGLLELALHEGRLTPAQVPLWRHALANDFAAASARLKSQKPVLHTVAFTEGFGSRRLDLSSPEVRFSHLHKLVQSHMSRGLSYDEAWELVKRENRSIFDEMQTPAP